MTQAVGTPYQAKSARPGTSGAVERGPPNPSSTARSPRRQYGPNRLGKLSRVLLRRVVAGGQSAGGRGDSVKCCGVHASLSCGGSTGSSVGSMTTVGTADRARRASSLLVVLVRRIARRPARSGGGRSARPRRRSRDCRTTGPWLEGAGGMSNPVTTRPQLAGQIAPVPGQSGPAPLAVEIPLVPHPALHGRRIRRGRHRRDVLHVVAADGDQTADEIGPQQRGDAGRPATPVEARHHRSTQTGSVISSCRSRASAACWPERGTG